jgi:oligopeptide transport system substrate-binding protein
MRITKALFEGLLRLDAKTALPSPGLADRWDVSADGMIYTFDIRTNASWSTGQPITSEDVAYSWRRALTPSTAADYAGQLFCVRNAEQFYAGKLTNPAQLGIHAVDARTFRVELNSPVAFFPDICCMPVTAVVPRQTIDRVGDRWLNEQPLPTSGPYQLVSWRLNEKVRLRRNPLYWDAAQTRNEIVDLLPVSSPNSALNLYETGLADVVWDKDLVPTDLLDLLVKRPDFHAFNYLGTCFFRFNVTRKPFDDARVRRAFALATDRGHIVRKLTHGGETAAAHLVPNSTAHYSSPPGLRFDPEAARKLLAQAGFPGGKGFPRMHFAFYAASGGAAALQARIGVELQQTWREVLGVEVELRQIERKIFYAVQSRLDYDLSASSWIADYNDASTFLDLFTSNGGNNWTGWKNGNYDEFISRANLEIVPDRRAALLRQAEEILVVDECPIVPLYFYAGFNYFDPAKIQGIYQNVLDEHPLQVIKKVRK